MFLFAGYKGFQKGFVLEILTILAFILAIIGGFKLLHLGMAFLSSQFHLQGQLVPILAFALIFIGIIIIVNILGKFLKSILNMTLLGPVDNIAGAIVAILKWGFGLSLILWLSNIFGFQFPNHWIGNSLLYPFLITWAPQVMEAFSAIIPFTDDLFKMVRESIQNDPVTG